MFVWTGGDTGNVLNSVGFHGESLSVDLVFDVSEATDFSFASYHLVALPVHFYIVHTTNIVNELFFPLLYSYVFSCTASQR